MKSRGTVLGQIVAAKRDAVAQLRPRAVALRQAAAGRAERRDFAAALRRGATPAGSEAGAPPVALIAEVKKASPSAGIIRPDFDPVHIAAQYATAGAAALSVLTDEPFFQGSLHHLEQIRQRVRLPLLRKDFTIDELQIYEAAAHGADAILLIVAILDDASLRAFGQLARELRLAALVEVHDEAELDRALAAGAPIIGINNRNLKDFTVNLATTERLAARIPAGQLIVAESGLQTRADVERVARAGAHAILVGESLLRSGDIAAKVTELVGGA